MFRKFDYDIFTSVIESQYFTIKLAATKLNINFGYNSLLKLHLSLGYADFIHHKEQIEAILIKYLQSGDLFEFKYINDGLLEQALQNIQSIQQQLIEYQKNPNPSHFPKILESISNYVGNNIGTIKNHLIPKFIQDIINLLNEGIQTKIRFQKGDQFTIYLPLNYKKENILNLCKEIEEYVTKNNLAPGKISDVAVPLTAHINLRQEYLTGDNERIDATKLSNSNLEKREQVKEELYNSDLYRYLHPSLNSSQHWNRLFFTASATTTTSTSTETRPRKTF